MLNKDLHKMNFIMAILYFTAGVLSIFTGFITDVFLFLFLLLGICFEMTGIAYLYTYGLEREMMNQSKVNKVNLKVNLDDTRKFQKV